MKIPVAILGATGMVGQQFVALLQDHPLFEIAMLAASPSSVGKSYGEASSWRMATPLHPVIEQKEVEACAPKPGIDYVFSALEGNVAGQIERAFAQAGAWVFSSTKAHRMEGDTPLLIPEVNADHLSVLQHQPFPGKLITHPNCVVAGVALALKPLHDAFGIRALHIVTLQATSGAGYPGVSNLDILDNVVPYIEEEEEKIEREIPKILGSVRGDQIVPAEMVISAQCHRVPVREGHLAALSVALERKATVAECKAVWETAQGLSGLPSAPEKLFHLFQTPTAPQPRQHASLDKGMAVCIGRIDACPVLDLRFSVLSHNLLRGGAGGTLLTAEMVAQKGDAWGLAPSSKVSAATPPLSVSPV